jgi:hypothetical protein
MAFAPGAMLRCVELYYRPAVTGEEHMVDPDEVIAHARSLMALAESVEPGVPGAAGLAYQAADLASKVLLIKIDGSDIWSHSDRERRLSVLLGIDAADLRFLHETRQLDFYADRGFASRGPMQLPTPDEGIRAVEIAHRVIDAIDVRLRPNVKN